MSDFEHWVGVIAPRIIGLVLVAYSLLKVYRVRTQFFRVTRGLVVTLFIITVALLWIYETVMSLTSLDWRTHPAVAVMFVVTSSWLSLWIVAVTTRFRRYFSISDFKEMVVTRPVNPISAWGAVGILIVVVSVAASPLLEEDLAGNSWMLAVVLGYFVVTVAIDVSLPVSAKRRGELRRLSPEERLSMALLASSWVGLPAIEFFFDLYLRAFSDANYETIYSWLMLAMFVLLMRSVMSRRFTAMVVDAEVEMSEKGGFRSYDIPRGVYLFEDTTSRPATDLFVELVTLPLRPDVTIPERETDASPSETLAFLIPKGLMVTRVFPDRIREEHPLQVTPIVWLTESPGERRIPPTSVALLTDTLMRFMEGNPNSIVMIDGMEYLATFNEFGKILKSLDSLNETAWITRSRLIIAVNPDAFEAKQVAMLERDRTVIKGKEGIEELKLASQKLARQI